MKKCILILMVLPALLLASCSLFGEEDGAVSEIEEQRRRWERLAIDTYEYDLTLSCFCVSVGPVRVQVRADTVFSATALETGEPVTDEFRARTIDSLFDVLEDAVVREAHRLDTEYDDTFHHPTLVDIDYNKNVVDEEVQYTAENFRALRVP